MTTRYSLPRDAQHADTARTGRTLAALLLVVTLLGLSLLSVFVPSDEPPLAVVPESTPAPAPSVSVSGA
jgi:hypothetical protein